MATSTLVPLGEYLHTMYHPDCDWIDGEVRERNMGDGQRVQVAATRFRVPDICATHRSGLFEDIIRVPPLLCIKVLSPDDQMSDMQEKVDDHLSMGVRTVWVVDPRRRTASQTDARSLQPVLELTVPETQILVTVDEVFTELDELEGRV